MSSKTVTRVMGGPWECGIMKSVRKVIILEQPTVSDESVDNCLCFIDNHSCNRYLQNIYYAHGSFLNIMDKDKMSCAYVSWRTIVSKFKHTHTKKINKREQPKLCLKATLWCCGEWWLESVSCWKNSQCKWH